MTEAEVKLEAAKDLYEIIKAFNDSFRDWEEVYDFRANFRFKYDEKSGRKSLDISDVEPVNTDPISESQLERAGETVRQALDEVEDKPAFIPPETTVQEEVRYPELTEVTQSLQAELRIRVKSSVTHLLMAILTENDVLLLSALGIDGRQKILDVLIEECQALKEDFQNGTSRYRERARP